MVPSRLWSARGLMLVCVCSVMFGVYLRVQELAYPPALTFDEHHFVENARNYLAGKADWNDHPPLGKLLIAAAIAWHGDDSVGWRSVPLGFGLLSIVLAYFLGRALTRDPLAGAFAAAFVALDGFLIAFSRTALLDGMLTALALGCVLALSLGRGWWRALAVGVLLGLTASIKFSGVTLLLPCAWIVLSSRERWPVRSAQFSLVCALGLLVFYAQYALGRVLSGQGAAPSDVVAATRVLVVHHLGLTQMTHPLTSHWYTWWLPTRPITLRFDWVEGRQIRAMSSLGNPLLWWTSTAAMLASLGSLLWLGARRLMQPSTRDQPRELHTQARVLVGLAWVGFLSPWILTARDSYIYHYLPAYALGLVWLGGLVAQGHRRWPRACLVFVSVVVAVSIFYAPVWAQLPISPRGYDLRLFLHRWR